MHLLQIAMAGLPTLLGVTVAIARVLRGACGEVESVLLKKLLESRVCGCCDEKVKKMRRAGEVLLLP